MSRQGPFKAWVVWSSPESWGIQGVDPAPVYHMDFDGSVEKSNSSDAERLGQFLKNPELLYLKHAAERAYKREHEAYKLIELALGVITIDMAAERYLKDARAILLSES